jgi:hypothetical protein
MSSGNIARHRNYSALLQQHEKDQRLKRMLKVFTYFLVILIVTVLLIIVIRWEKRTLRNGSPQPTSAVIIHQIPVTC